MKLSNLLSSLVAVAAMGQLTSSDKRKVFNN
jgi:hypothetical protein